MSKLSEFVGSPKEIDILGKKITIFPLKVKDLSIFKEDLTDQEKLDLNTKLIKLSLNDDSVTEEEIGNMSLEVVMILLNEISKLNGLKDDKIERIKEKIARRKPE